jgi:hypothetical protein
MKKAFGFCFLGTEQWLLSEAETSRNAGLNLLANYLL